MKKQLFKALAATAIVGAVMAMSSVVASAEPWLASDTSNIPEVFGFTFTDTTPVKFTSKRKGTFVDPIFGNDDNKIADKSGIDLNVQTDESLFTKDSELTTGVKKSTSVIPKKTGVIRLYVVRDGSATTPDDKGNLCLRVYAATASADHEGKFKRNSTIISQSNVEGRDDTSITSIDFEVKAGERYSIYSNNGNVILLGAEFVEETEAKTAFKADNGSYYIVSVVTPEQAESATKLVQKAVVIGTELDSTNTVYEKISIGGSDLDATAFGGKAGDYLYATKLTDVTSATDAENAANRYVLSILE